MKVDLLIVQRWWLGGPAAQGVDQGSCFGAEGSSWRARTGSVARQSCDQGRAELSLLLGAVFGGLPLLELVCICRGVVEAGGVSNCL